MSSHHDGIVGEMIDGKEQGSASTDRAALAQQAFIWGMLLVLFARFIDIAANAKLAFNQFYVSPDLAKPDFKSPGPNVDTLYGFAWLDLTREAQIVSVPDTADRYYSIQLQDAYMNTFNYIGRRKTGTKAGAFAITPPGFTGNLPAGAVQIKAPHTKIFAFSRTMVRDPGDLAAACAAQEGFTIGPVSAFPAPQKRAILRADVTRMFPYLDFSDGDPGYFDELNRRLETYPPLEWDKPNLARFASLGIGAGAPKLDPALAAELAAAIKPAYAVVKQSLKLSWVNGWAKRANVPPLITDPLQRAANSFYALATLVSEEGVYYSTRQGGIGDWLDGTKRYRLRFAAGQTPPVDAFWSLTLYDGTYSLFANPIDRYAILDRTEGLHYAPDGALEIQVQTEAPPEGISNWLPAPPGPFQLMIRAYQPRAAILNETYRPPEIEVL